MVTQDMGQPSVTFLGRYVRALSLDRNPLRRASDRAESVLAIALVLAFFLAAPLAVHASGNRFQAPAPRAASAFEPSRHKVSATVLTVLQYQQGVALGGVYELALVQWTAPDGRRRTGDLAVAAGEAVGARITLWTMNDGQLAGQPVSGSQARPVAILGAVAGGTALAVVLMAAGLLGRWLINRRRMAAWDEEWQATGPRWSRSA
jgi:hypothetical protein